MSENMRVKKRTRKGRGFSLIEVLVGITLMAIALVGLAELFTLSVMNNLRSSEITNATFLAQQEVDYLRTMLGTELGVLPASADEQIDLNGDGMVDFRRITQVQNGGSYFTVRVLVFPPSELTATLAQLTANPDQHRVKARINTMISR